MTFSDVVHDIWAPANVISHVIWCHDDIVYDILGARQCRLRCHMMSWWHHMTWLWAVWERLFIQSFCQRRKHPGGGGSPKRYVVTECFIWLVYTCVPSELACVFLVSKDWGWLWLGLAMSFSMGFTHKLGMLEAILPHQKRFKEFAWAFEIASLL